MSEPLYRPATDDDFNSPDGPRPEKIWVVPSEPTKEIDIAARWMLHYAYKAWGEHAWEFSFPDIGMHDFDRICTRMEELLPESPDTAEYDKAYEVLKARAVDDPFAGIGGDE